MTALYEADPDMWELQPVRSAYRGPVSGDPVDVVNSVGPRVLTKHPDRIKHDVKCRLLCGRYTAYCKTTGSSGSEPLKCTLLLIHSCTHWTKLPPILHPPTQPSIHPYMNCSFIHPVVVCYLPFLEPDCWPASTHPPPLCPSLHPAIYSSIHPPTHMSIHSAMLSILPSIHLHLVD